MNNIHYRKAEIKDDDTLVEIWKSGQHHSIGNLNCSFDAGEIQIFFLIIFISERHLMKFM